MSTGGQHVRRRHPTSSGMGAAGAVTRETHGHGYNPVPTDPYYGGIIDYEAIQAPDLAGPIIDGAGHIVEGSLPAIAFDPTPPAEPTGFSLSSEVAPDADGHQILRLVATLTQPTDLDLYGSWVEYTSLQTAPESDIPDWDRPQKVFIPAANTKASVEGVAGATKYWGRAYAVDVQGNRSPLTAEVSHTTGRDTEAPPVPTAVTALPGFRGFGVSFDVAAVADLMFAEVRYAPDDGTGTAPNTSQWSTARVKTTAMFVSGLVGDAIYWVQVRAVDLSGNVATSIADPTAVDYIAFPEAGWSAAVSVTTSLVGASDIAFNSITAAHMVAGSLDASDIGTGTLVIRPLDGFARGIEIRDAADVIIGRWDELGLKILDPLDTARYLLIDAGNLKFTTDAGETFPTAITPEGINASSITFGNAPGGHNLVLNSSFELAGFVAAPSTFVFTDFNQWAAANRVTAPDNITDGGAVTNLAMTAAGF